MSDEENWYVLSVDDVDETVARLIGENVPCNDVTSQYSRNAVAFPASSIDTVVRVLNKQSTAMSLDPTNRSTIFILNFHDGNEIIEFVKPKENFEGWDDILPVLHGVYEVFGIKIISSNPHKKPCNPVHVTDDKTLPVHFWSTPSPTKNMALTKVFGIHLTGGQCDALEPTYTGITIRDDDGQSVAEYVDGNLYILFDLPHVRGDNVTELFTRIMREYFVLKDKTGDELTYFYQKIRGGSKTSSKEAFVRACSKLYEKKLAEMEKSKKAYDITIDEYNQRLIENMRERDVLLLKLDPLRLSVDSRKKWADTEYETLLASPHVKDVMVTGKTINVFTDMITIHHNGKDYNIGEFKISINTDGDKSGVRAYNLTNSKAYKLAHPHVKIDGECCLGNISSGVTKYLSDYQYVILAQLMITYLQSYNPDNMWGSIELWAA